MGRGEEGVSGTPLLMSRDLQLHPLYLPDALRLTCLAWVPSTYLFTTDRTLSTSMPSSSSRPDSS